MSVYAFQLVSTLAWVVGCTAVFFWLLWKRPSRLPGPVTILLLALFIRIVPALVLQRGALYEIGVFRLAADTFREGQNIYHLPVAHPYLPMQLYWFIAADWLTENVGLFFEFWLKSSNILADVGITWLLIRGLGHRYSPQISRLGGLLYAVNPVTLMVVSYQGQFDATTMFFVILAGYLYEFYRQKPYGLSLSAAALGLAILNKTWPLLFLPIILIRLTDWRTRLQYTAVSAFMPLAGIAFYEILFPNSVYFMLRRGMSAGSISGWWGYSAVSNAIIELTGRGETVHQWFSQYGKLIGRLAGFATIYFTRKTSAAEALLAAILAMFALVPNLGVQGLSWIVPLAILLQLYRPLGWYVGAASVYMVIAYWLLHLVGRGYGLYTIVPHLYMDVFIQLASLTIWLVIVGWNWQWWRSHWQRSHYPLVSSRAASPP
ncbi:MAG: hypothetical protein IPM39_13955 [Chloroflexi bacterium]|nr:hypothetical protein [Chloroflexota bacterium]